MLKESTEKSGTEPAEDSNERILSASNKKLKATPGEPDAEWLNYKEQSNGSPETPLIVKPNDMFDQITKLENQPAVDGDGEVNLIEQMKTVEDCSDYDSFHSDEVDAGPVKPPQL